MVYLEKLLALKPSIAGYIVNVTQDKMDYEITSYKDSLMNGKLYAKFNIKNMVLRNISSIGASRELESYLKSGKNS